MNKVRHKDGGQALPRRDYCPVGTEREKSKHLYQNSPLRNSDKIYFSAFFVYPVGPEDRTGVTLR